ncbi:hypothetical protein [Lacisediminihabitans sp.]|uniref:hypothetical protein n=1 Tax=Lacisediminihabitans sp. TaxID=2787631 RepID=UPI002F93E71C
MEFISAVHDWPRASVPRATRELRSRSRMLKVFATRLAACKGSALRQAAAQVFLLESDLAQNLGGALRIDQEAIEAIDVHPLGRVMIVAGPEASTLRIALHVAACAAAGNSVSLALTTAPNEQTRELVENLRALGLVTLDWATTDADGRWTALPDDLQVAILTRTHVSVESQPPVSCPGDCGEAQSRAAIIRLYSGSLSYRVPIIVCAPADSA